MQESCSAPVIYLLEISGGEAAGRGAPPLLRQCRPGKTAFTHTPLARYLASRAGGASASSVPPEVVLSLAGLLAVFYRHRSHGRWVEKGKNVVPDDILFDIVSRAG